MKNLITNLIEKLKIRKKLELNRMETHKEDLEMIFVSSGRIIEIENIIKDLEDMLTL